MRDHVRSGAAMLSVCIQQQSPMALDVAFNAAAGEVLALVGPSGSGKTTTLRAIAGLWTPLSGHIALGDEVWFDSEQGVALRPERRRVGLVFQDYALFPHLTVFDNVAIAMRQVAASDRPAAARDVLERVGIAHLSGRRPLGLSGGERQRVGIARALARDPDVLLLDEPFSAVDRPTREQLKREVSVLTSTLAIPTVLVTHDIDDAVALAQRLVVIDAGKTVADGVPAELRAHPPTVRIAEILAV